MSHCFAAIFGEQSA